MGITGKPHDISMDVEIIQGAIAGEHAGIAAYRIAGGSGLLAPDTLKVALLFKSHHEGHRDALAKLISDIGTTPIAPKSDDDYISELKLGTLKSQADILSLARTLERGAAGGYISQISSIRDSGLSQLFAQISADEMIHWTTLNGAIGGSLPAEPFQFG
ncbi:MAG TPA: ferritin-like domain-containing protein [Steroidobacteraceae bacterium]|jgi:rubrerythrin